MTRVIAGRYKGRALTVPASVTRPTSSRVREAVLSAVDHAVGGFDDLAVLDLFAGSGALGIEALSRGADHAVLVDNDSAAVSVIRANLATLGIGNGTAVRGDVIALTQSPNPYGGPFDVVFADPPYALGDDDAGALLARLAAGGWLALGALVVLERSAKSQPQWPADYSGVKKRTYGDTAVWYGRFEVT